MAHLDVVAAPNDRALAQRLLTDLTKHGHVSGTGGAGDTPLLLILSPSGLEDTGVQAALITALDARRHIVPVLAAPVTLPHWIDHLTPLDFNGGAYPLNALLAEIARVTAPGAGAPITVLTPSVRRANRRAGLVVTAFAVVIFVAALYMVGVLGLRRPADEYDEIETQRVEQRNTIIGPTLEAFLPRSTAEALDFPATVEALPTRLRPFIASTATAEAAE
jgi:hypothetical protein